MNKHTTESALKLFLLIIFALTSSCAPLTAVPSPTATPAPSQTPTATVTPSPTNTPEPIQPEGVLVYLNSGNVITTNIQIQDTKTIFKTGVSENLLNTLVIDNNMVYIASNTDKQPYRSEIVRINLDGSNFEQLLPLSELYWPNLECGVLSPNKRYLLCQYGNNWGSMLVMDIETKSIQPIPAQDGHLFQTVSWSPDSQKVYFLDTVRVGSIDGVLVAGIREKGHLLEFSLETNKLSELLPEISKPGVRWEDRTQIAEWSPDGSNLLINLACNSSSTDILDHPYIFNVDDKTTAPVKVDGCISKFEWSPDGKKIAFRNSDLFIYDIASENLQTIPVNGQHVFYFAWSPSGNYILYSAYSSTKNSGVYLLNVSDGNVVQVMPNKKYSYTYQADDFTWSPSGNIVLFRQWAQDVNGWELYLLNADTKTVDRVERQVGDTWYFHQMWSPDGKYFIFIGGNPTRTFKIQNAYSGEQIEIKVPNEIKPYTTDLFWMINNSVYHSGGPKW